MDTAGVHRVRGRAPDRGRDAPRDSFCSRGCSFLITLGAERHKVALVRDRTACDLRECFGLLKDGM